MSDLTPDSTLPPPLTYSAAGVDLGYEIHPGEDVFDGATLIGAAPASVTTTWTCSTSGYFYRAVQPTLDLLSSLKGGAELSPVLARCASAGNCWMI